MSDGFSTADVARAARLLLDAVSSLDETDDGGPQADSRWLLALEPLGLDIEGDASLGAALTAAVDLIALLSIREATTTGASREAVVSNIRQFVLPTIYPEA